MDTRSFYANLPVLDDFQAIARPGSYVPLPDDWHVLISDIEGSTVAIQAGRYKDVNLLGASTIMAVINAVKPLQVPYVFGGDGASLAVPAVAHERAAVALRATRKLANERFNLSLRIGSVPVREIRAAGHDVLIAKVRVSQATTQAAFTGGGLPFAEQCIKDKAAGRNYSIDEQGDARGSFNGLECRWSRIPSAPGGEIVTLLVESLANDPDASAQIYGEVIDLIRRIYGDDATARPVRDSALHLSTRAADLDGEARIRARFNFAPLRILRRMRLQAQMLLGRRMLDKGITAGGIDWGRYKREVTANTDFRKFDDRLRHVLSGNARQREELTAALQERCCKGQLAYGLHVAPTALMTCLVFERSSGQHVHFIDGSDGGYAMAAIDLKARGVRG